MKSRKKNKIKKAIFGTSLGIIASASSILPFVLINKHEPKKINNKSVGKDKLKDTNTKRFTSKNISKNKVKVKSGNKDKVKNLINKKNVTFDITDSVFKNVKTKLENKLNLNYKLPLESNNINGFNNKPYMLDGIIDNQLIEFNILDVKKNNELLKLNGNIKLNGKIIPFPEIIFRDFIKRDIWEKKQIDLISDKTLLQNSKYDLSRYTNFDEFATNNKINYYLKNNLGFNKWDVKVRIETKDEIRGEIGIKFIFKNINKTKTSKTILIKNFLKKDKIDEWTQDDIKKLIGYKIMQDSTAHDFIKSMYLKHKFKNVVMGDFKIKISQKQILKDKGIFRFTFSLIREGFKDKIVDISYNKFNLKVPDIIKSIDLNWLKNNDGINNSDKLKEPRGLWNSLDGDYKKKLQYNFNKLNTDWEIKISYTYYGIDPDEFGYQVELKHHILDSIFIYARYFTNSFEDLSMPFIGNIRWASIYLKYGKMSWNKYSNLLNGGNWNNILSDALEEPWMSKSIKLVTKGVIV